MCLSTSLRYPFTSFCLRNPYLVETKEVKLRDGTGGVGGCSEIDKVSVATDGETTR